MPKWDNIGTSTLYNIYNYTFYEVDTEIKKKQYLVFKNIKE
jgi:hypothetical protein